MFEGYSWYIIGAYGAVMIILLIQWFIPWQRWKKYSAKKLHE